MRGTGGTWRVVVWERMIYFFFNDTATTEIYTLSLHDALPIWPKCGAGLEINFLSTCPKGNQSPYFTCPCEIIVAQP